MKIDSRISIILGLVLMVGGGFAILYQFSCGLKGCGGIDVPTMDNPNHVLIISSLILGVIGLIIFVLGCIDSVKKKG